MFSFLLGSAASGVCISMVSACIHCSCGVLEDGIQRLATLGMRLSMARVKRQRDVEKEVLALVLYVYSVAGVEDKHSPTLTPNIILNIKPPKLLRFIALLDYYSWSERSKSVVLNVFSYTADCSQARNNLKH